MHEESRVGKWKKEFALPKVPPQAQRGQSSSSRLPVLNRFISNKAGAVRARPASSIKELSSGGQRQLSKQRSTTAPAAMEQRQRSGGWLPPI